MVIVTANNHFTFCNTKRRAKLDFARLLCITQFKTSKSDDLRIIFVDCSRNILSVLSILNVLGVLNKRIKR